MREDEQVHINNCSHTHIQLPNEDPPSDVKHIESSIYDFEYCEDDQSIEEESISTVRDCINNWLYQLDCDMIEINCFNNVCSWIITNKLRLLKVIIFLLIWKYLYYRSLEVWEVSLEGCEEDAMDCLVRLVKVFDRVLNQILKFATIHFVIVLMGIYSGDWILKLISFSIFSVTFWDIYQKSDGFNFKDHSQVNFILVQIIWGLYFSLYWTLLLNIFIYKNCRRFFIYWFITWTLLISYFINLKIINSCSNIQEALVNNDGYSEAGGECKWNHSDICWHQTFNGAWKPLFWLRSKCDTQKTDLSFYFEKNYEGRIVGFPNPVNFDEYAMGHFNRFRFAHLLNMQGVNETEMIDPKNDMEVFLDLREKNRASLNITLKDYRLLHPGTEFLPVDDEHLNILVIFMDTISRQRFHRKFKRMKKFLSSFHYSKQREKRIYEFFRYHSINGTTVPNMMAAIYGNYEDEFKKPLKRIDTFAREKGYVTGVSNDYCNGVEDNVEGSYYL